MDLQILSDVREQLEHAAVAGMRLLGEDFRLKRSALALEPLAKVNPIFGRIAEGLERLLSAPEEERGSLFLDVLSLVDAVIYTQGTVGADGELTPLPPPEAPVEYQPLPYSVLQPLLEAMTGSGSGRLSQLQAAWEAHPAYFRDYRVLPAAVAGLGDSYADISELCMNILRHAGPEIVPLLKRDFDTGGGRAMVKRVQLAAVRGTGRRGRAKMVCGRPALKPARGAGGRHSRAGRVAGKRCSAARSGADGARKVPGCSSARPFRHGRPGEPAPLAGSPCEGPDRRRASFGFKRRQCGRSPRRRAAAFWDSHPGGKPLGQDDGRIFCELADAIGGKDSPAMAAFWRKTAVPESSLFILTFKPGEISHYTVPVHRQLQSALLRALAANPSPALLNLAAELGQKCPERYLGAAFLASLMTEPAEKVYDEYSSRFIRTGLFKKESPAEQGERLQLMDVLSRLRWSQEKKVYQIRSAGEPVYTNGVGLEITTSVRGFSDRWLSLLIDPKAARDSEALPRCSTEIPRGIPPVFHNQDETLAGLIRPGDPACGKLLGQYFYERALQTGDGVAYSKALLPCGWTQWSGFAKKVRGKGRKYQLL